MAKPRLTDRPDTPGQWLCISGMWIESGNTFMAQSGSEIRINDYDQDKIDKIDSWIKMGVRGMQYFGPLAGPPEEETRR